MITRIAEAFYFVSDMPRAVAFYRDVLGLTVVEESTHWSTFVPPGQEGSCKLGLLWTDGKPVPVAESIGPGAHPGATLSLQVDNLIEAISKLEAAGVRFHGEVSQGDDWGRAIMCEDPDRNLLLLIQFAASTT